MRNKAPLALMEQLVMILVFALAAALCLQIFVFSSLMSREGALRDRAVTAVQNTAEVLKTGRGSCDALLAELEGEKTDSGWQKTMMYDQLGDVIVRAELSEEQDALLGMARISAQDENGKILFEMQVYWQE